MSPTGPTSGSKETRVALPRWTFENLPERFSRSSRGWPSEGDGLATALVRHN